MESPFRDDREAAHMRAEQLAEENDQLRRELEHAKNPNRAPSPPANKNALLLAAAASAVSVFGVVAFGLASFFIARRPVHVDASPLADGREHVSVTWTVEHVPTTKALHGVWTDGRDTYAVGEGGTILYRTPSGTWSSQQSGTTADLNAVLSDREGSVYAFGDRGTILRLAFDTRDWVAEKSNTAASLHAAVAFGPFSVLAVGSSGTALSRGGDDTWHFIPIPSQEDLYAISETQTGALYAVGNKGTILFGLEGPNVVAQKSGTTEDLRGIVSTGLGGDLFAVGMHGTAIRASSTSAVPWANERSEAQSDLLAATVVVRARYEQRSATSASIGETNAVVAVGRRGVYLVDNLHARNGFEVGVIAGGAELFAVAASDSEAYAVGASGTVVHGTFVPRGHDPGF